MWAAHGAEGVTAGEVAGAVEGAVISRGPSGWTHAFATGQPAQHAAPPPPPGSEAVLEQTGKQSVGRTGLGHRSGQHEGIDAAPRGQVAVGEAAHALTLVRQEGGGLTGLEPLGNQINQPANRRQGCGQWEYCQRSGAG